MKKCISKSSFINEKLINDHFPPRNNIAYSSENISEQINFSVEIKTKKGCISILAYCKDGSITSFVLLAGVIGLIIDCGLTFCEVLGRGTLV